jgi:hypothetical protein
MNDAMDAAATTGTGWWGNYTLDEGTAGYWRIGVFEMWARRTAREWQVYTSRGEDPADDTRVVDVPSDRPVPEGDVERKRFAFRHTQATLRVLPALADRGVVLQPESAFSIPSKEDCRLYVSTPVWVMLYTATSDPVMDVACHRPSDTWFGPNTRVGELCYSSRTRASQAFDAVTRLPHRAISVVNIRNRAAGKLEFERIMLPVRNLSLYADATGHLWTEAVTLEREEDGDFAGMRLGRGAPDEAGTAKLVSGPRERHEKGLSLRAFGSLLK